MTVTQPGLFEAVIAGETFTDRKAFEATARTWAKTVEWPLRKPCTVSVPKHWYATTQRVPMAKVPPAESELLGTWTTWAGYPAQVWSLAPANRVHLVYTGGDGQNRTVTIPVSTLTIEQGEAA